MMHKQYSVIRFWISQTMLLKSPLKCKSDAKILSSTSMLCTVVRQYRGVGGGGGGVLSAAVN